MAIIVGTPTTGVATSTSVNDGTFDYTCPTGARILVFGITVESGANDVNNDTTLSNVKWNGVPMLTAVVRNGSGAGRAAGVFYLIYPASGAHSVTFTATPTMSSGITGSFMFCVDLTGDVSSRIGDFETRLDADPSILYTVQGTAGVVFDVFQSNNDAIPDGAPQVAIYSNQNATAFLAGASYQPHSGSDITNAYTGTGAPRYAGAEFIEGTLFTPQMTII